ncbi:MAG: cysteine hydrolase [Mucilaginibacter polytrichastri]|nr:cysteine hydrolase [Mucilaginibacter polytrichastri]
MKALLIIDMQRGCFSPYASCHDTLGTIRRINELIGLFRDQQWPLVFVRHDGTKERELIPGTDSWQFLPELDHRQSDVTIEKTANDAFYRTGLHAFLKTLEVDELIMTGYATDYCIDSTVKSALVQDYAVTVVADAHTTSHRRSLPATDIIKHYHEIWTNTTPTRHGIRVVPMADLSL